MGILEVFEGLHIPEGIRACFETVSIEKVAVSRKCGLIRVYMTSTRLISYENKKKMESVLKQQVFSEVPGEVVIVENYQLSGQYTPEKLFAVYYDSLLEECREKSFVDYSILKSSSWEWNGEEIVFTFEDHFLAKSFEKEFRQLLDDIFTKRFHLTLPVRFDYVEPTEETAEGDDYALLMQQAESRRRQQEEAAREQKAQEKEEKARVKAEKREERQPARGTAGKSFEKSYRKRPASDPDVFYGRNVEGDTVPICEIQDAIGEVVVRGQIVDYDERDLQSGRKLVIFSVTDFTDTISAKLFLKPDAAAEVCPQLKKGNFVKVKGVAALDPYDKEVSLTSIIGIKPAENFIVKRRDDASKKRVELHAHTFMSDMDGMVSAKALVKRAKEWGHPAIAITDHGVVQGFTEAFHALEKKDPFKVIYGCECYLVDDTAKMVWNEKGQTFDDTFVVFDLETTGFSPVENQIIEIGAVKVRKGLIVDRFSTFVNPEEPIPFEIEQLTSITDEMVMEAETIREVYPKFLDFVGDSVLVAHNASFDTGFINEKGRSLGYEPDFTVADTVAMSRILLPHLGRHTLNRICRELNISLEHHHRAVDDAEATAAMFLRFLDMFRQKGKTTLQELQQIDRLPAESAKNLKYFHCILLAQNDTGRVNLYKLVSLSHIEYYNKRPLMPKSLIEENREGLIIGSACEAGELFRAIVGGRSQEEISKIVSFYDYLEIQPIGNNRFMMESDRDEYRHINTEEDLRNLNRQVVKLGEYYKKPVVATCDVHFLDPEDEIYRRIIQAGKGFKDADNQAPLYLHSTEEMLEEFSYLGPEKAEEVVITNSNLIADRIENIAPVRPDKCPPVIEDSDKTLTTICYDKAHSMYGDPLPSIVEERLKKELNSIISNGFAVMYIIAQKLVWKSNEDGYLVGSRGSVGSSFVATMSGITEVNPLPAHYYCPNCKYSDFDSEDVKAFAGSSGCDMPDKQCPVCGTNMAKDGHDIPFETFLGFYGDKEPDIDLNFSGEYQSKAHDYTEVIFGKGHTFRAGTIGTLADKTAFGYVLKYYEERGIHKRKAEVARLVQGCVGVRRTTGQHPGGIIVLPHGEEIYSFTPVQRPANDMTTNTITTHFDYHSIDHNLLKLDILGHDDPTMIRMLEDLTGINAREIPLDDEKVLSLFENLSALGITKEDLDGCDLGSLGIPEFGTDFVMQMLRDTKPRHFSDLVRISGLSHGTDVWLNNAQELIAQGKCTLSTAICTRDDIMTYLIHTGVENGLAFKIMESVRKGKGLTPDMEAAMEEAGVPDWYIWSCKQIKYMFPKAHAVAYVMMAFRIAYCKVYYPLAYYAAFFSIRAKAFNYELMCQGKERLQYYINDYRRRSNELSNKEQDSLRDMRIVQEMYARGLEFMPLDIYRAKARDFQIIDGKLMPPFAAIDGLGEKAAEAIVEAAKEGPFLSREDFRQRCKVSVSIVDLMADLGMFGDLPLTNQISLEDFLTL